MNSVVRAAAVYLALLVMFRLVGKRSLAETGAFDLALLLIVSEATQQAMIDGDNSITNAFLVVPTLLGPNVGISLPKQRSPRVERPVEDAPPVILTDGRPLREPMDRERVDENEILQAAPLQEGPERLDQSKDAVLERGGISVLPKRAGC